VSLPLVLFLRWACVMDCEALRRYLLSYLYTTVELGVTLLGRRLSHIEILLVCMHSIGGHGGKGLPVIL